MSFDWEGEVWRCRGGEDKWLVRWCVGRVRVEGRESGKIYIHIDIDIETCVYCVSQTRDTNTLL